MRFRRASDGSVVLGWRELEIGPIADAARLAARAQAAATRPTLLRRPPPRPRVEPVGRIDLRA